MSEPIGQGPSSDDMSGWHAVELKVVLEKILTSEKGLTSEEAAKRLERFGPNRLPPPRPRSWWVRLLGQFHNVLIYVLLGAAVVTFSESFGSDRAS